MSVAEAHVPPQNLEAEESVLGALMVSDAALNPVFVDVRLRAEDFYRERHRLIFNAIKRLDDRSEPIDALTVTEHLRQLAERAEAMLFKVAHEEQAEDFHVLGDILDRETKRLEDLAMGRAEVT